MSDKEYNLCDDIHVHRSNKNSERTRNVSIDEDEKESVSVSYKPNYKFLSENACDVVKNHKKVCKSDKSHKINEIIRSLRKNYSSYTLRTPSSKVNNENFELCNNLHKTINFYYKKISLSGDDVKGGTISKMQNHSCDKTTYCRPTVNNQDLTNKTMAQNLRLKCLVHKLALARQQEKDNTLWDNYIKNLRMKHDYISNDNIQIEGQEEIYSDSIRNYYKNKLLWRHSMPCKDILLDDLHKVHNSSTKLVHSRAQFDTSNKLDSNTWFQKDLCYYSTTSRCRLRLLRRELLAREEEDSKLKTKFDKTFISTKPINKVRKSSFKSVNTKSSLQTDEANTVKQLKSPENDKAIMVQRGKHSEDLLIKRNQRHTKCVQLKSVLCMESKLELLIESLNHFIHEMKSQRELIQDNNNFITNRKGELINNLEPNLLIKDNFMGVNYVMTKNMPGSAKEITKFEMTVPGDKNADHTFDLDKKKNNTTSNFKRQSNESSDHLTYFEIPTRDCFTEVTESLSQHNRYEGNDKFSIPKYLANKNVNMAINTDPLTLMALMKISTDALKGYLSFIPDINFPYLHYLQLPKLQWAESHRAPTNCNDNIHSASNIENEDLNNRRCVHPQLLYNARSGLFRCQFCRRTFTRAYCCELHHQTCARSRGMPHDDSNLMLLS